MDYDLQALTLTDAELKATERLLANVFPAAKHLRFDYLHWQYRQNPAGPAIGYNAFHNGELVAHYVTIPTRADIFGQPEDGVLSLNTATHPSHAGKGLFTRLAALTYAAALARGCTFVVGVANQNSTYGFVRKLGFTLVSPLDVRVAAGLPRMAQHAHAMDYLPIRSSETSAWRLASPYVCYGRSHGKSGLIEVAAPSPLMGIRYVLDYVAQAPASVLALDASPPRPLRVWAGLRPDLVWPRGTSVPIAMRLRPVPLNLIFRDLSDQKRTLHPGRVMFSAFDFDLY